MYSASDTPWCTRLVFYHWPFDTTITIGQTICIHHINTRRLLNCAASVPPPLRTCRSTDVGCPVLCSGLARPIRGGARVLSAPPLWCCRMHTRTRWCWASAGRADGGVPGRRLCLFVSWEDGYGRRIQTWREARIYHVDNILDRRRDDARAAGRADG